MNKGYFDGPLITMYDAGASAVLGAPHWRVCVPFSYYVGGDPKRRVYVEAGYLTDGASVPRAAWSIIPPWGQYGQAAVVHDLLCEYLQISVDGVPTSITRAECDSILLEAMQALAVPDLEAKTIYESVNLYRVVSGTEKPTNTARKRALEAQWHITLEQKSA